MASAYPPVDSYKIYIIVNSNSPTPNRVYGLQDTHKSFEGYDEAEQWIREEGEKYQEYTILKTYKML